MQSSEQIAKYEAWVAELEARQRAHAIKKPRQIRFFVGALLASSLGFFIDGWIGFATLFTGGMVCMFGCYVVLLRGWEYTREIRQCRATIATLRAMQSVAD